MAIETKKGIGLNPARGSRMRGEGQIDPGRNEFFVTYVHIKDGVRNTECFINIRQDACERNGRKVRYIAKMLTDNNGSATWKGKVRVARAPGKSLSMHIELKGDRTQACGSFPP
jgi:hypothetical protein